MGPRVIVTRRWPEPVERLLAERFNARLNHDDHRMTRQELAESLRDFDAVLTTVGDELPEEILKGGIRARFIGNFGVGYNHIAIDSAREHGITVTNTPGVLTDCTADLAITLMLMVARRAGQGERELRAGVWKGWCPTHMIGRKVTGRTLGIVGMGRIGRATARRAHFGFGMSIIFHNRSRVDDAELRSFRARQCDTLEELLASADVVSLHCPGGDKNRGLIDRTRIAEMRPHSFFINTARGDVVDEGALIDALENGCIAGAGLDVFANEARIPERLKALHNVVLLPHLGSATEETRVAMGMKVLQNLTAFYEGREPPDRIT
ncbi:2-hydroxyacid dehydrogenase [Bradyrhizobium genosp. P]|uniref:2-hydroxyacid dehydrogenase n=1 Tax=Bradyrhizobium genosp. P TaxID=83641 RepID=UPI003CF36FB1